MLALYGFVLSGTVFHALSNGLQKKLLNQGVHEHYMTVVWMLGASFVGFLGSFVFYGVPALSRGFLEPYFVVAILNVFIMFLGVKAKQLEDVSLVEPISSIAPVLTIPLAIVILGEWRRSGGSRGSWGLRRDSISSASAGNRLSSYRRSPRFCLPLGIMP